MMIHARAGIALALALTLAVPASAQGPSASLVTGPREGDRAPDFSLPWASAEGPGGAQWFSLSSHRGHVVVLAFYPQDFTSGCTAQMRTFAEQYGDLFGEGVTVVGISTDSIETHIRFAQSLTLPFRLLSDPDQSVARTWGSAGDAGQNRRTVFVIDPRGKVTYADRRFGALDPKAYERLKSAVLAARGS